MIGEVLIGTGVWVLRSLLSREPMLAPHSAPISPNQNGAARQWPNDEEKPVEHLPIVEFIADLESDQPSLSSQFLLESGGIFVKCR